MIAPVERDQHAPPRFAAIDPGLIGDLDRHLDGGGTVIGEEHPVEVGRQKRGKPLGESDRGLVRETREHHMLHLLRLARERCIELRMGMAVRAGPPRRDHVEDFPPVRVEQGRALGARDHRRLGLDPVLGVGMPDITLVARDHVARARRVLTAARAVVHGLTVASFTRSNSGSMVLSVARSMVSSHGISAMTSIWP